MHWADARGYLVDLDGTLIRERMVLPWAAALLESVARNFVIVSNDSEHTPEQMGRFLRAHGLQVQARQIVLAGATTIDTIAAEQSSARLLLLGGAALRGHARRLGLVLAEDAVDMVVVARDRQFSYAKLAAAANAIRRGATLVVANPDSTHPGPDGEIVPETGALFAALAACVGPVRPRIIGKPEPALFEAALARLGVAADEAVMIGDNEETDGLGAMRLGLRFLKIEENAGRDTSPRLIPLFGDHPCAALQIGD